MGTWTAHDVAALYGMLTVVAIASGILITLAICCWTDWLVNKGFHKGYQTAEKELKEQALAKGCTYYDINKMTGVVEFHWKDKQT